MQIKVLTSNSLAGTIDLNSGVVDWEEGGEPESDFNIGFLHLDLSVSHTVDEQIAISRAYNDYCDGAFKPISSVEMDTVKLVETEITDDFRKQEIERLNSIPVSSDSTIVERFVSKSEKIHAINEITKHKFRSTTVPAVTRDLRLGSTWRIYCKD